MCACDIPWTVLPATVCRNTSRWGDASGDVEHVVSGRQLGGVLAAGVNVVLARDLEVGQKVRLDVCRARENPEIERRPAVGEPVAANHACHLWGVGGRGRGNSCEDQAAVVV